MLIMEICYVYLITTVVNDFLFNIFNRVCVTADTFTIGYLTGSQRREGDNGYSRPGLSISGAISLAVEEIRNLHPLHDNHTLDFIVAETYGDENESILKTAILWTQNISVYLGPQETCVHEGRMAAAFKLPMISYFCAHYETSNKQLYPTFARTRPPDTQISKSVASVLRAFRWKKIALLYSSTSDHDFAKVAKTIRQTLQSQGIEIRYVDTWKETYLHGYGDNPFDNLVKNSYQMTRIYVIVGYYYEHVGMMISLQKQGLLENGEYFVIGVDVEQYDTSIPQRYLKGLLKEEVEDDAKKAFQSYIGVVGSPPIGFENFTYEVNNKMKTPPFNYSNIADIVGGWKKVPAEGAYLYDAVYVYARALNNCLKEEKDPFNGHVIFEYIKGQTYRSAMGYMVYIDENGDAEGNYTLIARKPLNTTRGEYGLYPVGVFQLSENNSAFPILKLIDTIDWVNGKPPVDEPTCGFNNEKCAIWKFAFGITGGLAIGFLIFSLLIYRYWSYEQELDSLIWKIDYKDIQINEYTPTAVSGKANRNFHPLIRTSQISLSSNPDADFRYSTIYTQIGVYRGRVFAIRRFHRKSIDITRKMKKELKTWREEASFIITQDTTIQDNPGTKVGIQSSSPNLYHELE
ncbi:guanylate cyclase 32E-like [Centruroides sculpturatus]|uniref:guanylate cyclase 32E-like n=1 Tax=Centruroides sculpturatus TaxID=218467 RepID=UPI000C6DD089|nr:guanylate cyclase 32E-like [Centruroides sculpturatus]